MVWHRVRIVVLVISTAVPGKTGSAASTGPASAPADLTAITEALEKRQARVKTAVVEWTVTLSYSRHSMSDDQGRRFPDRETVVEKRYLLMLDGEKNEKVLLARRPSKPGPPAARRTWPITVGAILGGACVAGGVAFWVRRRRQR